MIARFLSERGCQLTGEQLEGEESGWGRRRKANSQLEADGYFYEAHRYAVIR